MAFDALEIPLEISSTLKPYRPCVFTNPMGLDNEPRFGLFHHWIVLPPSYGTMGIVYGLIELEDGNMAIALSNYIRFLDSKDYFDEYQSIFMKEKENNNGK